MNSQIFWFGDLNYRINMLDAEVRKLVDKKQWAELLNNDQVKFIIVIMLRVNLPWLTLL